MGSSLTSSALGKRFKNKISEIISIKFIIFWDKPSAVSLLFTLINHVFSIVHYIFSEPTSGGVKIKCEKTFPMKYIRYLNNIA